MVREPLQTMEHDLKTRQTCGRPWKGKGCVTIIVPTIVRLRGPYYSKVSTDRGGDRDGGAHVAELRPPGRIYTVPMNGKMYVVSFTALSRFAWPRKARHKNIVISQRR